MADKKQTASLMTLLTSYRGKTAFLVVFAIATNALGLAIPLIVARGIDAYTHNISLTQTFVLFSLVAIGALVSTLIQNIAQVKLSEQVARDLRTQMIDAISNHSHAFVQKVTPSRLLTNITTDIDSIKNYVSQAVVNIIASVVMFFGSAILLLSLNWKMALIVLSIVPVIVVVFGYLFKKVGALFVRSRGVVDKLNKIINESVIGAGLIRLLNSESVELGKFDQANKEARAIGSGILGIFSALIPTVTFVSNLAVVAILVVGGRFVIEGTMSLGDFTAFNSYLMLLIFPIFMIGFMSGIIAQAQAGYGRIMEVLSAPITNHDGEETKPITGDIKLVDVSLDIDNKQILRNITFAVPARSKTAIVGPTAAGKSQLLHVLIGLVTPQTGEVLYENLPISAFKQTHLYKYVGFVFQDSVLFNTSLRENIAFNAEVSEEDFERAVQTAEITSFIDSLPQGIETIVSERGTSLSGGQKQRVMLARALALNPKVLFLDDFTARVDIETERRIMKNIEENYPDITIISVAQKIDSISHYDQIVVLMEGEVIATGTHQELMKTSPEYVQIYNSQQSLNSYEVQSE